MLKIGIISLGEKAATSAVSTRKHVYEYENVKIYHIRKKLTLRAIPTNRPPKFVIARLAKTTDCSTTPTAVPLFVANLTNM